MHRKVTVLVMCVCVCMCVCMCVCVCVCVCVLVCGFMCLSVTTPAHSTFIAVNTDKYNVQVQTEHHLFLFQGSIPKFGM